MTFNEQSDWINDLTQALAMQLQGKKFAQGAVY